MPGSTAEATVDGMAWSGFDRAVRRVPGGAAALFRAIDVPLEVIDRPGLRAPFRDYVRYFEVAARLTGDPHFGFRLGSKTRAERSGIPGYLVLNARRFRDAVRDLARTLPTLVGGVRVQLVEDREPPALIWSMTTEVGPAAQFTGHATAYLVRMLQAHRGRRWRPLRVLCAMPEPVRAERYRAGLGCPVVLGAPVNAIELSARDLRAEKADVDRHLHALLSTYAQVLLERQSPTAADLESAVRMALRDGLSLGRADLAFVARRLRASRRSLQRRLADRGLSLSALRDEERFRLAFALLEGGGRPIGEIAASLGYAEPAAFSRAFRRRFGLSPRSARRWRSGDAAAGGAWRDLRGGGDPGGGPAMQPMASPRPYGATSRGEGPPGSNSA